MCLQALPPSPPSLVCPRSLSAISKFLCGLLTETLGRVGRVEVLTISVVTVVVADLFTFFTVKNCFDLVFEIFFLGGTVKTNKYVVLQEFLSCNWPARRKRSELTPWGQRHCHHGWFHTRYKFNEDSIVLHGAGDVTYNRRREGIFNR